MKLMVKISVQVHPGAKKNEVLRLENGVWHIKVAAPPVEGKANDALIKFLGTTLDIPKSRISLEKGATSRHKIIAIEGLSEEQVCSLLLPS
jgi:uncharacterized protein (TIGR00251 family)